MHFRTIKTNVVSDRESIHRKFGLEADDQQWQYGSDRTHVEDVENRIEVQHPGHNHLLVLRVEGSSDHISLTLLDDPPLDLRHNAAIEGR